MDMVDYLLDRIKVNAKGCFEWQRATNHAGYGAIRKKGKSLLAHRESYRVFRSDPGKLNVCHECDNPPCINPAHLFLGTFADNTADALAKGRLRVGSSGTAAKLTPQQVCEVVEMYRGGATIWSLVEQFGVSGTCIYAILNGRAYKDVERPLVQLRRRSGSNGRWNKLNPQAVQEIRMALSAGERQDVIAQRFGICAVTVSAVKTGRIWGWVPNA